MGNINERKKFVLKEVEKGNFETAYNVNQETNKQKIRANEKRAATNCSKS